MKDENKNFNFDIEDYKIISNLIEQKVSILRQSKDFDKKYLRLTNLIEELEDDLVKEQKEKLDEIIKLFYETEEYYFVLSYSLGVRYGDFLRKL